MANQREELKYDCQMSIAYHHKREYFFRFVDAAGKAISLLALTSLGLKVNAWTGMIAVASGALTIATVVLDCSGMAGKHSGLAARYANLLSNLATADDETAQSLQSQYHIIEADEPPALRGLVQLCQDELDASRGAKVSDDCFSFQRKIAAQLGFGDRKIDWAPRDRENDT